MHRTPSSLVAVAALVATALFTAACGGARPTERSWSEFTSAKDAPSPVFEILSWETTYTFSAPDAVSSTEVKRFTVLNPVALDSFAMVEITWTPWMEEKPELSATITAPNGQTSQLDPHTITDKAVAHNDIIVDGSHKLLAPLPQLQVGYTAEIRIKRTYKPSVYGPGLRFSHPFSQILGTLKHAKLTVIAPEAMPVHWKAYGAALTPKETVANGQRTLVFEADDVAPVPIPESDLPIEMPVIDHVVFTTGASWQQLIAPYAQRVAAVNRDLTACAPQLQALVPTEAATTEEKVAKTLEALHRAVRYTGLELGENSIIPATPCEVLKRGYGDCKDQSNLLVQLLALQHIPARMALLNAGFDIDVDPGLPSLMGFNHAIVRVDVDKGLWVDPTARYARPGDLTAATRNRHALLVDAASTELITTPPKRREQNEYTETCTVTLPLLGNGTITHETSLTGDFEVQMRKNLLEPDKFRKAVERYAKKTFRTKKVKDLSFIDPADLSQRMGIRFTAVDSPLASADESSAEVAIVPVELFAYIPDAIDPRMFDEEDLKDPDKVRTAPLELYRAGQTTVEYHITVPEGFRWDDTIRGQTYDHGALSFGISYAPQSPTQVTARAFLRWDAAVLSPEQVRAVQRDMLKFFDQAPFMARFHNEAHKFMVQNQPDKAVHYLQDLIAHHPKTYEYHLWYARTLAKLGFVADARIAARKATKVASDAPQAWSILAGLLRTPDWTVATGDGRDLDAAMDAYRKTIALDPDDLEAQTTLAHLQLFDERGDWNPSPDDLNRAADIWLSLSEKNADDDDIADEMWDALVRAGRFPYILQKADPNTDRVAEARARMAALAVTQGAPAALAAFDQTFPDDEQRRDQIVNTAMLLVDLGHYPEASSLLQAAATGEKATETSMLARALARVQPVPVDREIAENPERPLRALLAVGIGDRDDWDALWAPSVRKTVLAASSGTVMRTALEHLLHDANITQSPKKQWRDILFSLLDIAVEGNDETGYQVTTRVLGLSKKRLTVYVVKENGRYYLAGLYRLGTPHHILHLLDRNRNDAAATWLDWAAKADLLAESAYWTPQRRTPQWMRIAAWSMAAAFDDKSAASVLPGIEAARSSAADSEPQKALDWLAAEAAKTARRWDKAATYATVLLETNNRFDDAIDILFLSALGRKKFDEFEKLYAQHVTSHAQGKADQYAARLAHYRATAGRFQDARTYLVQRAKRNQATAGDLNTLAWMALFDGSSLEEAIQFAERAFQYSNGKSTSIAHTLATLYAAAGKLGNAQQLLLQIVESRDEERPTTDDWYVVGLLAEAYHLRSTAVAAYCRVTQDDIPSPIDTYVLAQQRLRALEAPTCPTN